MLRVIRPFTEVVKEGRISEEIRHLKDHLWVSFWLVTAGPTQNQEVTISKIVTFFGASLVSGFESKMMF
jgi:hypothetical protein